RRMGISPTTGLKGGHWPLSRGNKPTICACGGRHSKFHRRPGYDDAPEVDLWYSTAWLIFRGSSAVEQPAVNRWVVGSNPTPGAGANSSRKKGGQRKIADHPFCTRGCRPARKSRTGTYGTFSAPSGLNP